MSTELIKNRLDLFEPEYKNLITSEFVSDIAKIIQSKGKRGADLSVIENGLMLYFLLFFSRLDLSVYLVTECKFDIISTEQLTRIFEESLPQKLKKSIILTQIQLTETKEDNVAQHRSKIFESSPAYLKYKIIYVYTTNLSHYLKYIPNEKLTTLRKIIGDIILGFYKIEDTVPLLQQELGLDPKTAALLGAEVLEFLAPLNDPNWQPPVEEDEGEESIEAATSPVAVPARAINISSVPSNGAPTPTENTSVAPPVVQTIPTIAPVATPTPAYAEPHEPAYQPSPAVPEPTYQSSQNDLRPGRGPLGEVPTYVPPVAPVAPPTPPAANRPRWSTDV